PMTQTSAVIRAPSGRVPASRKRPEIEVAAAALMGTSWEKMHRRSFPKMHHAGFPRSCGFLIGQPIRQRGVLGIDARARGDRGRIRPRRRDDARRDRREHRKARFIDDAQPSPRRIVAPRRPEREPCAPDSEKSRAKEPELEEGATAHPSTLAAWRRDCKHR